MLSSSCAVLAARFDPALNDSASGLCGTAASAACAIASVRPVDGCGA